MNVLILPFFVFVLNGSFISLLFLFSFHNKNVLFWLENNNNNNNNKIYFQFNKKENNFAFYFQFSFNSK